MGHGLFFAVREIVNEAFNIPTSEIQNLELLGNLPSAAILQLLIFEPLALSNF